jgi:hypothetical protein
VTREAGLGAAGGLRMKNYSIVRVGNEYVVQANEKSVLKIASRRKAERTVTDAVELMDSLPPAELSPEAEAEPEPSIARDPRVIPDPKVIPDPSEVP